MRKLLKVDAAGRVVLPQPVRKRFHLTPGSRLEIDVEPDGIRLRPTTPAPSLTDEDGLLVHEGEPTGDLLHAVEEARALRDEQVKLGSGVTVFCDTSVLVAACVRRHPHHARAQPVLADIARGTAGVRGVMSTHSVAELYSALTMMPVQPRILPFEAASIIDANVSLISQDAGVS